MKEVISDGTGNSVELEGEGDGDTLEVGRLRTISQSAVWQICLFEKVWFSLQYEYDTNETGDRVVLGRGTYGVVYAGRDLSNQVRIAIKEIPERDSRWAGRDSSPLLDAPGGLSLLSSGPGTRSRSTRKSPSTST